MTVGRSGAARDAIDRLGILAERLSHPLAGRLPGMLAMNLAWGPTPVPEALEGTSELLESVRDDPAAEPFVLGGHAYLLAQAGDIDGARRALDRMREIAERLGQRVVLWASWGQNVGRWELLAGDPERAEQALRPCYHALRGAGNLAFSSTLAGQLAHALVDLGRPEDAAAYATAARDEAGEADVLSQVLWRSALARALAEQGDAEDSLDLADEAVALAETTEWPNVIADELLDRARASSESIPAGARAHADIERASGIPGQSRKRPVTQRPRSSRQVPIARASHDRARRGTLSKEPTPGVLLKGEDGTHYFIPKTDLSGYAVSDVPAPLQAGADVAENVPRLHAFSVQRVAGSDAARSDAAHTPMPEAGSETVAFTPMPEGATRRPRSRRCPKAGLPAPISPSAARERGGACR